MKKKKKKFPPWSPDFNLPHQTNKICKTANILEN